MPAPITLRVAAVNLKRGGWNRTSRFHEFDKLARMLAPMEPPHIIFMSFSDRASLLKPLVCEYT